MNKPIKMFCKGMMYGVIHPLTKDTMKGTKDMETIDALCGNLGMGIAQGTMQTLMTYAGVFIVLVGVGYINSKISGADVKVKVVSDNKKK